MSGSKWMLLFQIEQLLLRGSELLFLLLDSRPWRSDFVLMT